MGAPATFDFNSDQVFTMVRQGLTVIGTLFLATMPADLMGLVVGIVPILVSVLWSLWRNADNWRDMVFSGTRQAILIAGAFAVGRGWVTDVTAQYLGGSVIALLSSAMSFWFYRSAPGPMLPGTTVVDPPK